MARKDKRCEYEKVDNPYPENELPDLDYGGCRYLGYAGITERRAPLYYFKCHCGDAFKDTASNVIKKVNPSCGCSKEKALWKESSSLFEKQMEAWDPSTDNPLEKKLPVFKGIVGREKLDGYSLVDKEVYDVWSKIMWVFSGAGYVAANYSKDNCRRLKITPPEKKDILTLLLHRCVLGLGHDICYKGDHINGEVTDNRKANLRVATIGENNFNKSITRGSESGLRGVKFYKHREDYDKKGNKNKRWYARVILNNKEISKMFFTKEEASWYRDLMAVDLHGEFAYLNHPENLEDYKSKLHTLHYK